MLTFEDQHLMAQQISQDFSASSLVMFKRDINEGAAMFLNRLGRKFNLETITTDVVANQQFYQFSESVLRIASVRVKNGSFWYTPELITSQDEWNKINAITPTATFPIFYFIRGFNELGLYPTPSQDVTSGLEVAFNPQHVEMTEDDFVTGTVTVTNGSQTVTHSATGFTSQMVGRWLQVTDGSDGKWYRISAYVSSSELTLENFYEGIGGSGRAFRIGQVMKIPQAYQDAPVFYALDRYYLTQNDQTSAAGFSARFDAKVKSAKATYGHSTANSGVQKSGWLKRKPKWIDLTPPVSYP